MPYFPTKSAVLPQRGSRINICPWSYSGGRLYIWWDGMCHEEEWPGTSWHSVWDQMTSQTLWQCAVCLFGCDLKDCICCWSKGRQNGWFKGHIFSLSNNHGKRLFDVWPPLYLTNQRLVFTNQRPLQLVCPWGHQWTDLDKICSHTEKILIFHWRVLSN